MICNRHYRNYRLQPTMQSEGGFNRRALQNGMLRNDFRSHMQPDRACTDPGLGPRLAVNLCFDLCQIKSILLVHQISKACYKNRYPTLGSSTWSWSRVDMRLESGYHLLRLVTPDTFVFMRNSSLMGWKRRGVRTYRVVRKKWHILVLNHVRTIALIRMLWVSSNVVVI